MFLSGFINGLTGENGVTAANIWAEIAPAAPYAAALILIKIGYNFVSGLINNSTRPNKKKVAR